MSDLGHNPHLTCQQYWTPSCLSKLMVQVNLWQCKQLQCNMFSMPMILKSTKIVIPFNTNVIHNTGTCYKSYSTNSVLPILYSPKKSSIFMQHGMARHVVRHCSYHTVVVNWILSGLMSYRHTGHVRLICSHT